MFANYSMQSYDHYFDLATHFEKYFSTISNVVKMPTHLAAHLHFFQDTIPDKKMQKSHPSNRTKTLQTMDRQATKERTPAGNSGLAKVAVHCYADRFVVKENLYSA
jgi:hypothetical protein